jgi:hypothetical protein
MWQGRFILASRLCYSALHVVFRHDYTQIKKKNIAWKPLDRNSSTRTMMSKIYGFGTSWSEYFFLELIQGNLVNNLVFFRAVTANVFEKAEIVQFLEPT